MQVATMKLINNFNQINSAPENNHLFGGVRCTNIRINPKVMFEKKFPILD